MKPNTSLQVTELDLAREFFPAAKDICIRDTFTLVVIEAEKNEEFVYCLDVKEQEARQLISEGCKNG
jgi:hypothetical protein